MAIDGPELLERVQIVSVQFHQLDLELGFVVSRLKRRFCEVLLLLCLETHPPSFIWEVRATQPGWAVHFYAHDDGGFQRLEVFLLLVLPVLGFELEVVLQPSVTHQRRLYKYNA